MLKQPNRLMMLSFLKVFILVAIGWHTSFIFHQSWHFHNVISSRAFYNDPKYNQEFIAFIKNSTTPTPEKQTSVSKTNNYETAVIITTHPIPSHPSLEILNETIESLKFLKGLSPKSQIIITVDNLVPNSDKSRKEYHLVMTSENRVKFEAYLVNLYHTFSHWENVKIIVSGNHVHLGTNIKKALDMLDPRTEFIYVLQQDLPFIKDINHTAIIKTSREYPEIVRLVRFNIRYNRILEKLPCWNQTSFNINGISLHKTPKWSDQNHFANVKFYREDVMPLLKLDDFPEGRMMTIAHHNCSYYGPHMYGKPGDAPFVKHTDGAERYGKKLEARINRGDVKKEDLRPHTLIDLKSEGIFV
mmetsp:Transcript_6010/g.6705  ORF Transcript_6010/g.6705 Transcript_6010/m.6705 type:complete len:358 (-) Transcript_6010:127-1200(-)